MTDRSNRTRRMLLAGIAAAFAGGALGAPARAEDAHVNHMSYEVQSPYQSSTVSVTSSTGARWDTILPGNVSFNAVMQVDTAWPGYVERVGIFLGKCSNTECGSNPRVYVEEPASRDYNRSKLITFSVEKLKAAAPSIFGERYEKLILDQCNKGHSDASTPHTTYLGVDTSFSVNTRKKSGNLPPSEVVEDPDAIPFDGGDHTRQAPFLLVIECLATSKTVAEPKEPHRTKVGTTDIDLFLSTYATPTSSGPRGTQCKPLKVTTRIGTDKAGPVNVKLWRQVNGGPITSEGKQMHASALGGAKFGDDWNKFEHFTQTTTVQYKAEVLGGTFAPSTPWKSITIHCNGDYASPQTNANPDSKPPHGKPLPPAIVTPPPTACATGSAAKVRGSSLCVKTAPLPDKRKQFAEEKRRAAKEADLRRREVALKAAEMQQRQEMHRPLGFGRFGGPMHGRFAGPGRPMMRGGFVMSPGLILK